MHYPSDRKRCVDFVLYFVGKQLKQKVSGKDWEMPEETGENSLFFMFFISGLLQSLEQSIPLVLQ